MSLPRVNLVPRFSVDHPGFVNRTRYAEFTGGLGDVFNHIYWLPCYSDLEALSQKDRAFILLSNHNSSAWELFAWHRNAHRMVVANIGFLPNIKDPACRKELGLPDDCDHDWPIKNTVHFYPCDEDLAILEAVVKGGRYIVFALTASDLIRSIPKATGEDAARRAIQKGYRIVVTGRNYKRDVFGLPKEVMRLETRLDLQDGIVDVIDRLTVPGTARLVEGAAGVFTSHSALCMLAWHQKKPTFVLYDELSQKLYFTKKYEGYSFGAGEPGNGHTRIDQYTGEIFERFLNGIVYNKKGSFK